MSRQSCGVFFKTCLNLFKPSKVIRRLFIKVCTETIYGSFNPSHRLNQFG